MTKTTTPQELRRHWTNGTEIALVDVREEGPYADAHPLFALTVPVSEIELKLPDLVPRLSAPIIVYDNGEGYVERAVIRITAMGYKNVTVLEGGLSAYARVGEIYRDVNVPSKAFGELVEAIRGTPSLAPHAVKDIIDNVEDVVVLDARKFEEYNTMSIPRGRSCPGGELVYRIFEAAPSPETTVVVHCAGRTRSLLGTQSLVNAGIPNKVVALRDGTIGWTLDGLHLDTGKTERVPHPSKDAIYRSQQHAASWAEHVGIPVIQPDILLALSTEQDRTLYLLDVRDPEEYAQGHHPQFASAPGGQLVQATDEWVGVRGARILLYDTDGVRARMAATWLQQLGWEVYVFDHKEALPPCIPRVHSPAGPSALSFLSNSIGPNDLETLEDATIIDLARSPTYRKGHIPGAWHASGPELSRDLQTLDGNGPIILTSPDGQVAAANVGDARKSVSRPVLYLRGGTEAWAGAVDQPLETASRWLSNPVDVYKRPYEGTGNDIEAMKGYIQWEHELIAQLANDGVSRFHVVRDNRKQSQK